jgi:hypothetical protein
MILKPIKGQRVKLNYKDKAMPFQDREGIIISVGKFPGPLNVLITIFDQYVVVPRGNLIEMEQMWIVDSGFAYGGLIIKQGKVAECAPIFRKWFLGRPTYTVKQMIRNKNWKLNEVKHEIKS